MGTTTVKIRTEDKERLDRIKANLTLKGNKLNQEELLGRIIEIAESHPMFLEENDFKVSKELKERFLNAPRGIDKGEATEKEIDEILYGDTE